MTQLALFVDPAATQRRVADPVPVFDDDSIVIVLNEDGTVTWQHISDAQREEAEDARS